MKYKGFLIEPVYLPGSDFTIHKNGVITTRKPTRKDIDYYTLKEISGQWQHANAGNISEAKESIDQLLRATGGLL